MTIFNFCKPLYANRQWVWKRTWMIIWLTAALTISSMFTLSAKSYAQKISISVKNVSIEDALDRIRQQSGYSFFWNAHTLDGLPLISVSLYQVDIQEAVMACLKNVPLSYKINGEIVYIERKAKRSVDPKALAAMTLPALRKISGSVKDSATSNPLAGVTIKVSGSNKGISTDKDGKFSLDVPDDAVLLISYIGYRPKTVPVSGKTILDITLSPTASELNELVVVGYGTKSKETLTGSVASVSGKELLNSPTINLASSFQGRLPGVSALQVSGEPGRDESNILVRGMSTTGSTSPLVVVDGVPDAPGWQYINSNDVESVSVLKDASAAIYGARAANGVILITTKRGNTGKPVFNYTFNQGVAQPTMLPNVGNSVEVAGYVNQLQKEAGLPPTFSDEELERFQNGSDPLNYPNTDWYDAVVKKVSTQSRHNLNVRGGNENVKYSVSGSFSNQESIFKKGSLNLKTYSVRSNMDIKVNEYIKLAVDLNAGLNNGDYPAFGTTAVFGALMQVPYIPVYWPNGSASAGIENAQNPAVLVTDATGNYNKNDQHFLGKASFNVTVPWVKGLSADGFFSYTNNNIIDKNWETPWTVYDYDKSTDVYTPHTGGPPLPQLSQALASVRRSLVNLKINYKTQFNGHKLDVFIAGEQASDYGYNFSAFRKNFISSSIDELFAGSPIDQQADGSASESARRNLFGRLSYGFENKYLLDFNFRYDGSSNFPKGKRYGFFPGLSVAWRLSQENFIKQINSIDELKLRASYGSIGNDQIDAFQYLSLYNLAAEYGYNFGSPFALNQGLVPGVSPNPNITWEVAKIANIGLDASLWKGLLGITFDMFQQRRSNILTTKDLAVPVFTGLSLPEENIGIVENKGMELQLTSTKTIGKVTYRVGANYGINKSKVVDLSEPSNIPDWQRIKGHVLGAEKYYHAVGIFRTQEQVDNNPIFPGTKVGDLMYEDVDGDEQITSKDMVMLDKTITPRVTYGFNLSLEYNHFSLWSSFAGQGKSWIDYRPNVRQGLNGFADILNNRYTEGSMDSKYPRLPTIAALGSGEVDGQVSDFWLFNTSYLRLKTLELAYTFTPKTDSKSGIKSLKVYMNGSNLFTLSKMKLFDPANTNTGGFYYPLMKIYNIGFNLTF